VGVADQEIVVVGQGSEAGAWELALDDRPPSESLADALGEVAGAGIRRLGGPLDYASVSLRGSAPRHVLVLLDGLPLNPDGASAVDLSELSLAGLRSATVHRGPVPVSFAAAPIGGAVALVGGPVLPMASLGVGSHGTARMRVAGGGEGPGAIAEVQRTDGDYRYYDNGGTTFNGLDDHLRRRANNGTNAVTQRLRWSDDGRLGLFDATMRDDGVPGAIGAETESLRLRVVRLLGGGGVDRGPFGLRAWALWRDEVLDDRAGELLGTPSWHRDRMLGAGATASASKRATSALRVDGAVSARGEAWERRDRLGLKYEPVRPRLGGTAVLGGEGASGSIRIAPAVALHGMFDPGGDATSVALLPRIGLRTDGSVSLRAAAWTGLRPPDLDELYVDRGSFHGNPDLLAERATAVDVGARRATGGPVHVVADTALWARDAADAIVWLENAARVWVPENVGDTRSLGAEALASLDLWGRATAGVSLAAFASEVRAGLPDAVGHAVPGNAPWTATARVEGAPLRWFRTGAEASWLAATPLDLAGVQEAPQRWTLDAWLHWEPVPRLAIDGIVRNALDVFATVVPRDPLAPDAGRTLAPVVDFVGFPLPGRTLALDLTWTP
jgi:outer membrane receptor protein involved in Fe transport